MIRTRLGSFDTPFGHIFEGAPVPAISLAAAVLGATLLFGGPASAAPATDRDPVPPDAVFTVCDAGGSGLITREDAGPSGPREPAIRCDDVGAPPCVMAVPARPVEPGSGAERTAPAERGHVLPGHVLPGNVEHGGTVERTAPTEGGEHADRGRHETKRIPACADGRVLEVVPRS